MTAEYDLLDVPALERDLNGLLELLLSPADPAMIPAQTRRGTRATRRRDAKFVAFSPDELRAYRALLRDLSRFREAEWLDESGRDRLLWSLTCDAVYHPDRFRDPAARHARVDRFFSSLFRPLQTYAVVLPLSYVAPPSTPVALWDSTLMSLADARFQPYLEADRARALWTGHIDPASTAVLVLDEMGTAIQGAVERARSRAGRRLHMLRAALAEDVVTHELELRFALGEHAFAIREGIQDAFWAGWRRQPAPMTLEITGHSNDQLRELDEQFALLQSAHPTVQAAVERTYQWLGRGLERVSANDSLRDYTTALEILLIAQSGEKSKSILLPYRMIALADLSSDVMPHPATIHYAYQRRSLLVHEGALEAMEEEAREMRRATSACLRWVIRFAAASPLAAHGELLASLDTPPERQHVLDWLAKFPDPWSTRLAAGVTRLPRGVLVPDPA